jgi:hypothetical protein
VALDGGDEGANPFSGDGLAWANEDRSTSPAQMKLGPFAAEMKPGA